MKYAIIKRNYFKDGSGLDEVVQKFDNMDDMYDFKDKLPNGRYKYMSAHEEDEDFKEIGRVKINNNK